MKIDNDIAMPPDWLGVMRDAAMRNPDYDLIGMEAGWTGKRRVKHPRRNYTVTRPGTSVASGSCDRGVHRGAHPALARQERARRLHHLAVPLQPEPGWVTPDLAVVQLDRLPIEPWLTLSARYVEEGWARPWDPYKHDMHGWWKWLPKDIVPRVRVA